MATPPICANCRGAGLILVVGKHRNTTEPCLYCKQKAQGARLPENQIIKGVPIPGDCRLIGGPTRPNRYPWKEMDVGDLWECEFDERTNRGGVLGSLRYHMKENPKVEFRYRLTHEKDTGKKGIEIWKTK